MSAELATLVTSLAQRARAASLVLATTPPEAKNAALHDLANRLVAATESLLAANLQDLAAARENGLSAAQIDRLTLTPARLAHLAASVRQVAALADPVGEILESTTRPNGLVLHKIRVPIGVIGIVYEARPNVTIDCAVLCLKSGNAALLRGGKECFHTNTALAALIAQALAECDERGITGKDITPFLLGRIVELSGGRSLETNIALVRANARLGAAVAAAYQRLLPTS